jgi:5-methylcytosine-specific restriction endonuclease McrA
MVIPANLRRQVMTRAANCCEYCGLAQTGQEATFHIDHVVPVVAGGQSISENLALACVSCSLRKGARLASVDHTQARRSYCLIRAETYGDCISAGTACEWWVSHRQDAQRSWRYT